MHYYLLGMTTFHYTLLYHIPTQMFIKRTCYKLQDIQFRHHLCVQPPYRMTSLCGRCELGRFLLCHPTKEVDLTLWHQVLTVNRIQYQCQTVFGADILHRLYRSSIANSSTGPDTFKSHTVRQIFVYLLQTEYKQLRDCT